MKHLLARVPPKLKPVVYGVLVAIPIGLYFLIHKTTPTTGSTSGTSTLTASGVSIPVGGPEHTTYVTKTVNHYIPRTAAGHAWNRYNFLQGMIHRAQSEINAANRYMATARRSGNTKWIHSLNASIANHRKDITGLNRESRAAWLKANKKK